MFRKSILLAVAATAALGLATLSASAGPHGHGHGKHGHWGHGHGHHKHFHVRYHRPVYIATRPVYVARPVVVAKPGPCTCLSKEYTPEGVVVFKDRCTNEMAMNPPPAPPQQTGSIEQPQFTQQLVQPTPPNALPPK